MPHFSVEDNASLYYELEGNLASNKTVVFLNGVMASTKSWIYQTTFLKKLGLKFLLHDFRGQLNSTKTIGPDAFKTHAKDLFKLMEHLSIDEAHIVGTSYGGKVALDFTLTFPEKVRTLSVINSAASVIEPLKESLLKWKNAAKAKDGKKFFNLILPNVYSEDFRNKNPKMINQSLKLFEQYSDDFYEGQVNLYNALESSSDLTSKLKNIRTPTCVITSDNDLITPLKYSKIIADNIENSKFESIPNCGHATIFEKPNELNTILYEFVSKN